MSDKVLRMIKGVYRWSAPEGLCRIQSMITSISMSGCFGNQGFQNSNKLSVEEYCKKAIATPSKLELFARDHKNDSVSKEILHESLDDLKSRGQLDSYSWKRLLHMTRNCNCTADRMYYKLKNFFGTERSGMVDQIKFKEKNPELDKTINGFMSFARAFQKQNFESIQFVNKK